MGKKSHIGLRPAGGPKFSRSGDSSPFGKFTAELPKTKVPEVVAERLAAKASAVGMSLTEYRRTRDMIDALGLEEVTKLHIDRLKVVAGKGRE